MMTEYTCDRCHVVAKVKAEEHLRVINTWREGEIAGWVEVGKDVLCPHCHHLFEKFMRREIDG